MGIVVARSRGAAYGSDFPDALRPPAPLSTDDLSSNLRSPSTVVKGTLDSFAVEPRFCVSLVPFAQPMRMWAAIEVNRPMRDRTFGLSDHPSDLTAT